jgi:hypothetical protein
VGLTVANMRFRSLTLPPKGGFKCNGDFSPIEQPLHGFRVTIRSYLILPQFRIPR